MNTPPVDESTPPPWKPDLEAAEFLADPYFYGGDVGKARVNKEIRAYEFQSKKILNVLNSFASMEALEAFMSSISMIGKRVSPYSSLRPLEDRLHDQIIDLNTPVLGETAEVVLFRDRRVDLTSSRDLVKKVTADMTEDGEMREENICFVLGPSGSGKTFFSLKYAAQYGLRGRYVTLYVKPHKLDGFIENKNPHDFVKKIREHLMKAYSTTIEKKLDMHVSLVVDEVGASVLEHHFEKEANLTGLVTALKALSDNVRLVVCGTGLTAGECASERFPYKFRMTGWGEEDLAETIGRFSFEESERQSVIDAILSLPTLEALSTNGRSAFFLFKTIDDLKGGVLASSGSWRDKLCDWTPTLISTVASRYIQGNGLLSLAEDNRRLVAASIFHCVAECRRSRLAQWPKFAGLDDDLSAMALALVELNVDKKGTGLRFIRQNEKCAILVTPAITVLLFFMLQVPVNVLSGWKTQELVAGLLEFRKLIISYVEQHAGGNSERNTAQLIEKISRPRLIKLVNPVPHPRAEYNFQIPRLSEFDVCLNGDKAPFGDVMAPNGVIVQAKYCDTEADLVRIEVDEELRKCGLMISSGRSSRGRIVLRSLFLIWKGRFNTKREATATLTAGTAKRGAERHLQSSAYPVNWLGVASRPERIEFVKVFKKKKEKLFSVQDGANKFELPDPDDFPPITFVFSTNAANIELKFGSDLLHLSREDLDEEGRVTFRDAEAARVWTTFIEGSVREEVTVLIVQT
jgi:uncharacterized protein YlbG (UPF0298 family)